MAAVEVEDLGKDALVKQKSSGSMHSGELLAWLQEKGRQEKWAINEDEIELEQKPFASGAAGEVYKAKWRGNTTLTLTLITCDCDCLVDVGLTCVAKTCFKMDRNKQNLIDLGNEISVISSLRHPNLVMFLGKSLTLSPVFLVQHVLTVVRTRCLL